MKKYLITGLLVWLPLAITVWVLSWLLSALDGVFLALLSGTQAVLPESTHHAIEQLRHVPGLGVLVLGVGLVLTGVFVTNIFGQWWVRQWDRVLQKIPIVKSIYSSVKQVSDTLFSSNGNAFREAVLVQYPRRGSWTIAFVTGAPGGEVASKLREQYPQPPEGGGAPGEAGSPRDMLSVYVPTTPNPTSGFFLIMPRAEVIELRMSVDEALKYVISMGVVVPPPPSPAPAAIAARN